MLTLLRVIARSNYGLILGRAKTLFHIPQFVARTRAVDSSLCRRTLLGRGGAGDKRSREYGRLACSMCGGRRRAVDLDRAMDPARGSCCDGHSNHRRHLWAPIQCVVAGFRCRDFVARHVGARSLVLRRSPVWPQTHHIDASLHASRSRRSSRRGLATF
jgi:hypothetical protein